MSRGDAKAGVRDTPEPVEPCGCALCLALLELAASAESNLRREQAERRQESGAASL
jgi:hypothetical protein